MIYVEIGSQERLILRNRTELIGIRRVRRYLPALLRQRDPVPSRRIGAMRLRGPAKPVSTKTQLSAFVEQLLLVSCATNTRIVYLEM
jgi:hypothetical protein